MKNYLLIALSFLLFLPNLFPYDISTVLPYNHIEKFNPELSYLNTLDKMEAHIDSLANSSGVPIGDNLPYIEIVANVMRDRFYHGFSHFTLKENWIAAMAGKYIWYDLSCTVRPDDIIRHDYAACSQQGIVMMKILQDKNIISRSVLFPHHFAVEALINNKWYYFDTNLEPNIHGEERCSDNWHNSADSLKRYYDTQGSKNLDYGFGKHAQIVYGKINEKPAAHARLFHTVTKVASKTAWIVPLLFLFIPLYRSSKKKQA